MTSGVCPILLLLIFPLHVYAVCVVHFVVVLIVLAYSHLNHLHLWPSSSHCVVRHSIPFLHKPVRSARFRCLHHCRLPFISGATPVPSRPFVGALYGMSCGCVFAHSLLYPLIKQGLAKASGGKSHAKRTWPPWLIDQFPNRQIEWTRHGRQEGAGLFFHSHFLRTTITPDDGHNDHRTYSIIPETYTKLASREMSELEAPPKMEEEGSVQGLSSGYL